MDDTYQVRHWVWGPCTSARKSTGVRSPGHSLRPSLGRSGQGLEIQITESGIMYGTEKDGISLM